MKSNKIKFIVISIWQGLIGSISPIAVGIIFMLLTGNGKGYGYDLRSETTISVYLGIFLLIIFLLLLLPTFVWVIRKYLKSKDKTLILPFCIYFVAFLVSVLVMGVSNFFSFFGM